MKGVTNESQLGDLKASLSNLAKTYCSLCKPSNYTIKSMVF